MCKVKRLAEINALMKELEEEKKSISAELYTMMDAARTDRMDAEDGSCFVKWVKVADKVMPAKEAYIKKGYEYVRVF